MSKNEQQLSPIGRFVGGTIYEPYTKTPKGAPLLDSRGQPKQQFKLFLAVDKKNPDLKNYLLAVKKVIASSWPKEKRDKDDFKKKYKDGNKEKEKDGYEGCVVFTFTSGFPPTIFDKGCETDITNVKDKIQLGDYVRIAGTIVSNKSDVQPGIILNLHAIEHCGLGERIKRSSFNPEPFKNENAKSAWIPPAMAVTGNDAAEVHDITPDFDILDDDIAF